MKYDFSAKIDEPKAEYFETDPPGLKLGVAIKNLRKVFGGNKVAVDNMSLNIFEGQILALLGVSVEKCSYIFWGVC